jgi:hypothetical protein
MQVNFLPDATEVIPALVHLAPALAAAFAGATPVANKAMVIAATSKRLFMCPPSAFTGVQKLLFDKLRN